MAKNFIQQGASIIWHNSTATAVASGQLVKIEDLIGVALVDIPSGASGAVGTSGVFEVPAVNDAAITQGAKVYYDASSGKMTPTDTDNTWAGFAWAEKTQAGTVVQVRLG